MESAESPLDVLSRAATMVQSNILNPPYRQEGGGGKWRRLSVRPGLWQATSTWDYPESQARTERQPAHSTTRINGEPIDLSTTRRGLPPSYSETISARVSRSSHSLAGVTSGGGESVVSSSSESYRTLSDPMIDEHFRRSLGTSYQDASDTDDAPDTTHTPATALSVDDHFAKSLGERWLELQREEEEAAAAKRENEAARLVANIPV